mgnify:CR=1 FL=1
MWRAGGAHRFTDGVRRTCSDIAKHNAKRSKRKDEVAFRFITEPHELSRSHSAEELRLHRNYTVYAKTQSDEWRL